MTKFAKISLVAAVAVTSLSAVDFSGYATYRFDNAANVDSNVYKAALTAKQKVSDDFTAAVGVSVRSEDTVSTLGASDANGNDTVSMNAINFTYTGIKNLTVVAGRQALNTPWTEGSSVIDKTQQGNGVLGLYNAGFATIAAGHFTNNNITVDANTALNVKDSDLNVVAAIVPLPAIDATAQAWYITVGEAGSVASDTNAASYNLAGKVSGVSYDARYSTLKLNSGTTLGGTATLAKIVASTNIAGIDFTAGYGKTGKNGGGVVAFDNDGDASFGVEIANLNGLADTKATLLGAAYNVLPNVNASLSYLNISGQGTANDANEIDAALTYTASKNMTAKIVYANLTADVKADDEDLTRIELAYKF